MNSLPARRARRFLHRTGAVLFGLCLAVLLIEVGLRVGGFFLRMQPFLGTRAVQGADLVIVCVGDSHTQGVGAPFVLEALRDPDGLGPQRDDEGTRPESMDGPPAVPPGANGPGAWWRGSAGEKGVQDAAVAGGRADEVAPDA